MLPIKSIIRLMCLSLMMVYFTPTAASWAQSADISARGDGLPAQEGASTAAIEIASVEEADKYCIAVDELPKRSGGLRYLSDGSGPFRIEYGKPLDRGPDDSSGQWEFTMGSMF